MVGDLSSEVVHCPNCKEDVPKTLYCLNCGYPLYKIEQKKTVMVEPEPETLEVVAPEEEPDMGVEIEQPGEPFVVEEPAQVVEEAMEEVTIEVEETEEDVVEEPEAVEEPIIAEPVQEPEYVLDEETQADVVEEQEEQAEETVFEAPEEELFSEPEEEPILEPEEEPIIQPVQEEIIPEPEEGLILEPEDEPAFPEQEEPLPVLIEEPAPEPAPEPITITLEPEEMEEIIIEFAPDPLTKEVMDSLAKNITLKIRLVKLLRDSQVKEETFRKLFDSYLDQGKIWVSRRDEIIKRFKADIDRMENALVTARKDHELLEIRKSIGDADGEEYTVKAPAYKWDIEHLDKEIKNRKGGIAYVVNLKKLVPGEEIAELKRMAETEYDELDAIENITQDTVTKIKETLTEALSSLQA